MNNSNFNIKSFEKFDNIITNFSSITKEINNLLKNEDNYFNSIGQNVIWQGELYDAVKQKYDELSNNYETIILSLNELEDFMKQSIELHRNTESSLNKDMSVNSNNLDFKS